MKKSSKIITFGNATAKELETILFHLSNNQHRAWKYTSFLEEWVNGRSQVNPDMGNIIDWLENISHF